MKTMLIFCLLLGSSFTARGETTQTDKLKNGVEILSIKDKTLPLVEIGVILKSGSTSDPMAKGGLTHLTVDSWIENQKIDEEAALLGGEFQHFTSPDYVLLAGSVFSEHRTEFLNLFMNLLTQPAFDKKSIDRKRQMQISKLKKITEEPDVFAEMSFKAFLFGPHPYGLIPLGKVADLDSISLDEVLKHYKRLFDPSQMIFILAGDFNDEFKSQIKSKLEVLPPGLKSEVHWPRPPEIKNMEIQAINAPGATQTQIILGHLGIERKNPDYIKLKVASVILGGSFSSRLNDKIRVQDGLTYNIDSEFESELKAGSFQINTSTKNENVDRVIKETVDVLKEFSEKGVTKDELESAKNYLVGMLTRSLETPEDHAIWVATEKFYGLKTRSLTDMVGEIKSVSLTDINVAIKMYINPTKLKITVVGPTKNYMKYLQTLGAVELK